jgi:hypothetical protein
MQKMYLAVDLIFKLTEPLDYPNTVFLHLTKQKLKKLSTIIPFTSSHLIRSVSILCANLVVFHGYL